MLTEQEFFSLFISCSSSISLIKAERLDYPRIQGALYDNLVEELKARGVIVHVNEEAADEKQ